MALDHPIDLGGVNEHSTHLGGLVGTSHPAFDAAVAAAAGADALQYRGEIPGSETDQGIVGIQAGDDHLAHFAVSHRVTASGTHNLQIDTLIDDQSLAGLGFVGDHTQISGGIALKYLDTAFCKILTQRRRQCLSADQGLVDAADVGLHLVGLLQDDLEEGRGAHITGGPQIGDGLNLEFGLAHSGGNHGAAKGMGTAVHHGAGGRQVVGETVVDQVPAAEAGGKQGTGEAPVAHASEARLIDRPRRGENVGQVMPAKGGIATERRSRLLQFQQL